MATIENTPISLRGSMNDCSSTNRFYSQGKGKMAAKIRLKKGRYEFKIASEDYKGVKFGSSPVKTTIAKKSEVTTPWADGTNLQFEAATEGEYLFLFDGQLPNAPNVAAMVSSLK